MNALNYLITADWKGKSTIQAVNKDLGGLAKVGKGANRSLTEMKSGLDLTMQGFQQAGAVVKAFYGTLKEGAALEAEQQQYENLARSIGTSADALNDELIPATKGMVSNADLVRGASELISLGLADTQEEVVAWSTAVSSLDLDLQVLGLTLANDSTARLDSLGLSMQDVNKRTAKFVALGYEAGEAFDMAVLEALEERMVLLGDASETTAGKLQRAEIGVQNLTDKGKLFLAQRWEPMISGLVDVTDAWAGAQADVDEAVKRGILTEQQAMGLVADAAVGIGFRRDLLNETRDAVQLLVGEEERQNQVLAEGQAWMEAYSTSRIEYNEATWGSALALDYERQARDQVIAGQEAHLAITAAEQAAMESARGTFANSMTTISSLGTVIGEAFGSEALGAEDAAERINTANLAISASYKQTAVDILQARLAETIEEDGLGAATAMIQFQEALGLITPEEAAQLQAVAEKTELITSTTNTMFDTYMADGVLVQGEMDAMASAVTLIGENSTLTQEQIIELSEDGVLRMGDLTQGAEETEDGFFDATSEVSNLKDKLWALPDSKTVDIYINTHGSVPSGVGGGGGSVTDSIPEFATGGMVPGPVGMPQLIVAHGGEQVLTREQQRAGGGGSVTINQYNNTREAAALAMAQAEQMRRVRMDKI